MKNTDEQNTIILSDSGPKTVKRIVAFAGTGKTYTLVEKALHIQETEPYARVLCLVFNKSIQREGEAKFPPNTTVKTCHGLAYGAIGHQYSKKLKKPLRKTIVKDSCCDFVKENRRVWNAAPYQPGVSDEYLEYVDTCNEVADKLFSKDDKKFRWNLAYVVMKTLNNYMYSGDDHITLRHVDTEYTKRIMDYDQFPNVVISMALYVYNLMADHTNDYPAVHDVYLKQYTRSRPKLGMDYDYIFLDEAQDANGAISALVGNIEGACKVYVGDPHQQIYEWRGSVNSMDGIKCTQDYALTQSFRFGPDLAMLATGILKSWKQEDREITGTGETTIKAVEGIENIPKETTILTRTNAQLLLTAYHLAEAGKTFKFLSGVPNDAIQLIKDVYAIYKGRDKDPFIKTDWLQVFKTPEDLIIYADEAQDAEVQMSINIIDANPRDLFTKLAKIESVQDIEDPDYILSTAHGAKGCEWPRVYLTADFVAPFYNALKRKYAREKRFEEFLHAKERLMPLDGVYENHPEANLVYVAVTRAQEELLMAPSLDKFLDNHIV